MNGTPAPTTTQRFQRTSLRFILALLALVLGTAVLASCESTDADRLAVINAVNWTRAQNGLPALTEHVTLNMKADAWAAQLRDECRIRHSTLSDGAPAEWRKLGENVGRGGNNDQIHTAYLNSPGHRANILDRSFNSMGAGAVWGSCNGQRTLFTVQVFMRS
ncbi:MAG: CAP domain-containing protein [Microthrixaceae bacterium]